MTDTEIKKALECCVNQNSCNDCPYSGKNCLVPVKKDALDLINRQQAEIERLNRITDDLVKIADTRKKANFSLLKEKILFTRELKTAKAEAIKEFAERLKAECRQDRYVIQTRTNFGVIDKQYLRVVDESDIDNLVTEMVGDAE